MLRIFGAAREIRTPDPIITNDVLYQLSYCGSIRPKVHARPKPDRGGRQLLGRIGSPWQAPAGCLSKNADAFLVRLIEFVAARLIKAGVVGGSRQGEHDFLQRLGATDGAGRRL